MTTSPRSPVAGRVLDATFGTGLFGVLCLAAFVVASRAGADAALLVAAGGAAVFLVPHAGLSWLRAWSAGTTSRALLAGAAVPALLWGGWAATGSTAAMSSLWTAAFLVLPFHVALQTLRVGRVLAAAAGADAASTSSASRSLLGASVLLAAVGLVGAVGGPQGPLVQRGMFPSTLVLAAGLTLLPVAAAVWAVRRTPRAIAQVAVLFVTAAAMFWVPGIVDGSGVLDPLATAEGPFMWGHAAQLTWWALAAGSRGATRAGRTFDPAAHLGLAAVLGALVVVDVPWVVSRALGTDLPTLLLAAEAAVMLHVAVVDVQAWRLGGTLGEALLVPTSLAPSGRGQVSNLRALAFAVPGLVLGLGVVVDVHQSWRVRSGASEADLAVALVVHPGDGRAHIAEAELALAHGELSEARASLGRLARQHAFAPASERLRLEVCVAGLDDVGIQRCGTALPAWLDNDPVALALSSTVALRGGNPGKAREMARRAVALAPRDVRVVSALGVAEARNGDDGARAHLEEAIALGTAGIGEDPLAADPRFLDVGLALADVLRRGGSPDGALSVLDRLDEAHPASRPAAALRIWAARARILDDQHIFASALAAYQRALGLAPAAGLPVDEVTLWGDYAALLGRSGAALELRYACALKAGEALARIPEQHPEKHQAELVASALRTAFEAALDAPAAARVRADLDSAAAVALQQSYGDAPPAAVPPAPGAPEEGQVDDEPESGENPAGHAPDDDTLR